MRTKVCLILLMTSSLIMNAQSVAINTSGAAATASSILDISSTSAGVLVPRMTTAQRTAIGTPATGLLVYDTSFQAFWYFDGTVWRPFLSNNTGWTTTGNAGTVNGTNFMGSTDNVSVDFRTNNTIRATIMNSGEFRIVGAGSAAAPIYSWTGDPNTGLYSIAADVLGVTTAGTERMRVNANGTIVVNNSSLDLGAFPYVFTVNAIADNSGIQVNAGTATFDGIMSTNNSSDLGLGFALIGFNNNNTGCGVGGSGGGNGVIYVSPGVGGTFTGDLVGAYAFGSLTTAATNRFGGYFASQTGSGVPGTAGTYCYIGGRDAGGVDRKITGTGTVNTIIKDLNEKPVLMSAPESPENLFMDYGKGQLVNGKATITLDPIFAKNIIVNELHDLRVIVQLEGDCNGVYVTNKTNTGFEVNELQGGTSNVKFTYQVVGNRADGVDFDGTVIPYANERFADAPLPMVPTGVRTNKGR